MTVTTQRAGASIGGLPVPVENGPAGSKTAEVTSILTCFRPANFSQAAARKESA